MRAKFGNKRRQRSPTKHSVSSDQAEMRQGHSYRALGTYPVSHRCPTTPHENLSARDGCGGRGSFESVEICEKSPSRAKNYLYRESQGGALDLLVTIGSRTSRSRATMGNDDWLLDMIPLRGNAEGKRGAKGKRGAMGKLVDKMRMLFHGIDLNDDNSVSREELGRAIRARSERFSKLSETDLTIIFNYFDKNGKGGIDVKEFFFRLGTLQLTAGSTLTPAQVFDAVVEDILLRVGSSSINIVVDAAGGENKVADSKVAEELLENEEGGVGCAGACVGDKSDFFIIGVAQVIIIVGVILALVLANMPVLALAAVGVLIYVIATFCCNRSLDLLSNQIEGLDALVSEIEKVYHANPSYRWHIECYHMERRTRRVKRGNRYVTETYYVKVVTHRATKTGKVSAKDVSEKFVPQSSCELMQLCSNMDLNEFQSNSDYIRRKNAWLLANRRDAKQDHSTSMSVQEHSPNMLVSYVPELRPWWMEKKYYLISSIFCCPVCYKMAFNAACGRQKYTFKKLIGRVIQ